MEDVMEGIVIPHWSFGSVLLLLCIVALVVVVSLVVVEAVRWCRAVLREDGSFRRHGGELWLFVL